MLFLVGLGFLVTLRSINVFDWLVALRAIVRENRAVPKDWGQPISFIFFSIKNQADKINFGDINKISRLFTLEIDHPPCFWPREALKITKNNGNFSGLKQFFLKELVHRFFSEAKVP